MNISPREPAHYANNPLAEVICQVRFERILLLEQAPPSGFQTNFAAKSYPKVRVEEPTGFALPGISRHRTFHFTSDDGNVSIAISAEFLAMTCLRYVSWAEFSDAFLNFVHAFTQEFDAVSVTRIGLRYRDVIDREKLGLGQTHWSELIQPFLLGPLGRNTLAEGECWPEDQIGNHYSQTTLNLSECKLLLQAAIVEAVGGGKKQAFLIDSDFFIEDENCRDCLKDIGALEAAIGKLHQQANDLFQRSITKELHNALSPVVE